MPLTLAVNCWVRFKPTMTGFPLGVMVTLTFIGPVDFEDPPPHPASAARDSKAAAISFFIHRPYETAMTRSQPGHGAKARSSVPADGWTRRADASPPSGVSPECRRDSKRGE